MVLWQVGDVRHPLAPPAGSSFYTWLAFATEVAKLYAQYRAIYKSDFIDETEGAADAQCSPNAAANGGGCAAGAGAQPASNSPSSTQSSGSNAPNSFAAVCARLQPAAPTTVFARFPIDNCDLWCVSA